MFKLTVVDNYGNARTDFIPYGPRSSYDGTPASAAFDRAVMQNETMYAVLLEWEPGTATWNECNRFAHGAEALK